VRAGDEQADDEPAAHVRRFGHVPRWVGYVAYDAAWSDPSLPGAPRATARLPRDGLPVLWLARYDAVLCYDHLRHEAWLVGDGSDACARLRAHLTGPERRPLARVGKVDGESASGHETAIRAALDHIAAGDIYQVNLARRWTAPFEGDPLGLALAMREASPVPLGMYLDAGDHSVVARTMERFLGFEGPGGRLETRPIKGTIARRGGDDEAEAARLRADDKERAEHAMIVDLMRNDVGRLAQTGTVRVEEVMAVEPYAKLSHLVSTVGCQTTPDTSLAALLTATFPPGSVTGTPKVRAVEIIEALERSARGIYTGAVGYLDRQGGASLSVAIRTAVVSHGSVRYHAGGGLVAASVPEREVAETELKAKVFFDAVAALRSRDRSPMASERAP
jgi:anthranilate/para-aminobenzoate synthase component I